MLRNVSNSSEMVVVPLNMRRRTWEAFCRTVIFARAARASASPGSALVVERATVAEVADESPVVSGRVATPGEQPAIPRPSKTRTAHNNLARTMRPL